MLAVDFKGSDDFRKFGQKLRGASKEQRKDLFKAVQRATKPAKEEIKKSARMTLPKRGGLNEWVADASIKTKQQFSGRWVGVTIEGAKNNKRLTKKAGRRRRKTKAGTYGRDAALRAINRGRVMHPAWGRGKLIGPQAVKPGFWDDPLKGPVFDAVKRELREELKRSMNKIARSV